MTTIPTELSLGAILFSSGHIVVDDEFSDRQSLLFQNNCGLHIVNRLRDVYPFNVLSDLHMQNKIGHLSLSDWIVKGRHGTIERERTGLWLWTVPPAQITLVRDALSSAGVLLS